MECLKSRVNEIEDGNYYLGFRGTQRVHVPNTWVLEIWVTVIIRRILGKYMIIRYLDLRVKSIAPHSCAQRPQLLRIDPGSP